MAVAAAALVFMSVFNIANLPSPLYVMYRERFHFSEITLTLAFAVYVVGSLAAMLLLGRFSDQVGRRPALFAAIAVAAGAALLFVFAFDTAMLFVARAVSGLAAGMAATACTAWIAELAPAPDRRLAAPMATGANITALGLGPLISGVLAQYAPWPLKLPFIVYLVGLVPPLLAVWVTRETVEEKVPWGEVSFRPRVGVPPEVRAQFAVPALTAFVVFAFMGFYSSLIPTLLERSLSIDNHAVGGAVIFFMFLCGVCVIAASLDWQSGTATRVSLALLIPGAVLLVLSQYWASLPLLLTATALGGAATALGYCGSLKTINEIAPKERRAETIASLLLACYAGISLPVIGIGLVSQLANPLIADIVFSALLCVLAAGAAVVETIWSHPAGK